MDSALPDNPAPPDPATILPGAAAPAPKTAPAKRRLLLKIFVGLFAFVVVAVVVLRVFVLASFFTPSVGMAPTLKVGDRFVVNRLAYRLGDVERGDIVVFKRPPGEPDLTINNLVKRVIGLPGDEVTFKDGKVFVNGSVLVEPYLAPGDRTDAKGTDVIKVPAGQVLVLGDNRRNSFDGRSFGTFDTTLIIGKVFYTFG
jgi:signal peptidase I